MATIPNTTIILYKGVPLDIDYKNTMYFADASAQRTFFVNYTKLGGTFNNNTYQRINNNTIRVQASADALRDCNYLSIKNASHAQKTYYGFITGLEYVNENTCEITYEIDVIQSYLFDGSVTLKECFVEREHSLTDVPGDNLQPENLDPGEYVVMPDGMAGVSSADYDIVVGMPYWWDYPENTFQTFDDAGFYSGTFSGYNFYVFNSGSATDISDIKILLDIASGNPQLDIGHGNYEDLDLTNDIIMFTAPSNFRPARRSGEAHSASILYIADTADTRVTPMALTKTKTVITNIGSYTPKNKKLLTYPYSFMYVTNPLGQSAVYEYEFFTNRTPTFKIMATYAPGVQPVLIPTNYKGSAENKAEKFTMGTYPLVSFNVSTFKQWLAQHEGSDVWKSIVNTAKTVGGLTLGKAALTTGNAALAGTAGSMIGSGVNGVVQQGIEQSERRVDAAHTSGSVANDTMLANGVFDFYFYNKHITEEYAQKIDLYFSMFGYACNKVKVPNISARPVYNYVKTNNCLVTGDANADVLKRIQGIFDAGVTFWKNAAYFGLYDAPGEDNSPQ